MEKEYKKCYWCGDFVEKDAEVCIHCHGPISTSDIERAEKAKK